ncbi:growth arrest-specific protein 2 [Biomphalaria pfeifferi]|uniref:Growth arrest-specific protein 2 n=1 Tax=Biomphalaria pfeifferi TaxID=112525 RepID=A0AAD8FGT6_BIOPF|nr:growth arrest-specific protein 2 [Biomphalaria pfeifferi]
MLLLLRKMIGQKSESDLTLNDNSHGTDPVTITDKKSFRSSKEIQTSDDDQSDYISQRRCKLQQELILSLKDDLSEWIIKTLGPTNISTENFIQALDNGVILCQLSLIIEQKAKKYAEMGKYKAPLPTYKIHCNKNAKSGTWLARDNTANFLKWCKAYGLKDENLFDSEDLVTHHKEMQVIYCLMELARLGARFGLEPPTLISMEEEIDSDSTVANIPPLLSYSASTSPEPGYFFSRMNSMNKSDTVPVEVEQEMHASLDEAVAKIAAKYNRQKYVRKISTGVYLVFGKQVFLRLLKGRHLMVRVGGGWDTFENYLVHHDNIPAVSTMTEPKLDVPHTSTLPQRAGRSAVRILKPTQRSASVSGYNSRSNPQDKIESEIQSVEIINSAPQFVKSGSQSLSHYISSATQSVDQYVSSASQSLNYALQFVNPNVHSLSSEISSKNSKT